MFTLLLLCVDIYINVDSLYGRIDDPDNGKPGYFTLKEDNNP